MIKLSVVIITLNEEKNIGRCLDSVKEIADEIVVVDSGSTDDTEAICKSYGARVIQHSFEDYVNKRILLMRRLFTTISCRLTPMKLCRKSCFNPLKMPKRILTPTAIQ